MAEFEVDDLVWVGEVGEPGVVVLAAGRPPDPDAVPGDLPDLNGLCCTPLALVRTLSDGRTRWVRAVDLSDLNGLCCTPLALVRTLSDGRTRWVRAVDLSAPAEVGSRTDGSRCGPGSES